MPMKHPILCKFDNCLLEVYNIKRTAQPFREGGFLKEGRCFGNIWNIDKGLVLGL